jgi:hypothetical protein
MFSKKGQQRKAYIAYVRKASCSINVVGNSRLRAARRSEASKVTQLYLPFVTQIEAGADQVRSAAKSGFAEPHVGQFHRDSVARIRHSVTSACLHSHHSVICADCDQTKACILTSMSKQGCKTSL